MKRITALIVTLLMFIAASPTFAAKTVFSNGDAAHGIKGTVVTAQFLNALQNHRHDGLDQDGSQPLNYANDTGTAGAYIISLTPVLTANITGMPISFKAANTNTGASTLKIDALPALAIKRPDGSALVAGDIVAGQVAVVEYNGVSYQLLNPASSYANKLLADGQYRAASATPGANVIPVGDANGKIAWGAQPAFRGALVYYNSTAATPAWTAEAYDTDNIHDNVTNPQRLTVPAGVTKVRLQARLKFNPSSISGEYTGNVYINKNGTWYAGLGIEEEHGSVLINWGLLVSTPVLSVVGGDYFTVTTSASASLQDTTGNYCWFAMEILE